MASQFQPLLDSITDAVKHENWLAALALALMLPDICGKLQWPEEEKGGKRYAKWWAHNFAGTYTYGSASDYVTGDEVWQLRCAYLHEGSSELQNDKKELIPVIEKFQFAISRDHLKKEGTTVLLNVRTFCEDMCDHVKSWETKILSKDPAMRKRAEKLLKIYISIYPSGISSAAAVGTPTVTQSE
jgi:hypothetical protein